MSRIQVDPVCIMVVGDGMADLPMAALSGKTPLQQAGAPHMATLAGQSGVRMVRTIPEGYPAGTETAMPLITGYDTSVLTGRGPVEAAGMGVVLPAGHFAMRANLVRLDASGMLLEACPELSDEEGLAAGQMLQNDPEFRALLDSAGWVLHPQPGFRQLITGTGALPTGMSLPHNVAGALISDHLDCDPTVSSLMKRGRMLLGGLGLGVWPWGAGVVPDYEPFARRFGKRGMVISGVPMVRGMALLAGLEAPLVQGANGSLHTNWRGKTDAVLQAARDGYSFIMLHVEAPDDCSHARDLAGKLDSIARLDEVLGWLLAGLEGQVFRLLLLPDHITSTETGRHGDGPVPWCVFDSRLPGGKPAVFVEHADILPDHYSLPLRSLLEIQ